MDRVCPICNGLVNVDVECPACGAAMVDGGVLENYFGSYSPYVDYTAFESDLGSHYCLHLLYCPNCSYDIRQSYELLTI